MMYTANAHNIVSIRTRRKMAAIEKQREEAFREHALSIGKPTLSRETAARVLFAHVLNASVRRRLG